MPIDRSKRRRPHVALKRGNRFELALHTFNRIREIAFPITYKVDKRGRPRPVGAALRANARACLLALVTVSKRGQWGRVYMGYTALGTEFDRSRSTAYRSIKGLLAAKLIVAPVCRGGKTYDESDQLVLRANGYELHPELRLPDREPRQGSTNGAPSAGTARRLGADQWGERLKDQARARRGSTRGP